MHNFVSRGGIKLQAAIKNFKLKIKNLTCIDVGSSTGGFVDCLLQNGAAKVYSVDTSYGELAWKLRNDPRVAVIERTNILHLDHLPGVSLDYFDYAQYRFARDKKAHLEGGEAKDTSGVSSGSPEVEKVDLITIDAGWTKLELVLPVVQRFLKPNGVIIALLKPHYEANKKDLVKGVLPPQKAEAVKNNMLKTINDLQFTINDLMESPILGGGGNKEYLLHLTL